MIASTAKASIGIEFIEAEGLAFFTMVVTNNSLSYIFKP
jgi:hypothetical protein